jgi:hypothetical protein
MGGGSDLPDFQYLSLILFVAAFVGCAPPVANSPVETPVAQTSAPPPPPNAGGAPSGNFDELLATSVQELQAKNEAHKSAWGLGTLDRWDLNQDAETLVFTGDDGSTVTTQAQIIGSFNTSDNSWLWAWDNPSIDDKLKADARQVQAYGQQHGIDKLTSRKWTGSEEDAWAMAALVVKLAGAEGAYRGPVGNTYVFIAFRNIQVTKANAN